MGQPRQKGASASGNRGVELPLPKGNRAKIPGLGLGRQRRRGRTRGRRRPSRGELSFLLDDRNDPGIGSPGDRVGRSAEHPARTSGCPERGRRPLKTRGSQRASSPAVPMTAAFLRGEQPLVERNNADKGSRQNGSITSGKGLALKVGSGGPPSSGSSSGRGDTGPFGVPCSLGSGAARGGGTRRPPATPAGGASPGTQRPIQNRYGPGESDARPAAGGVSGQVRL